MKTLTDLYKDHIIGNIKYNKPVEESNFKNLKKLYEDVMLQGVYPGGKIEKIGNIKDNEYIKLKRTILAKKKGGMNDLVDILLKSKAWDKGKDYEQTVFNPVIKIFIDSGISQTFVKNLCQAQKNNDKRLNFLPYYLESKTIFNIKEILISQLQPFTRVNEKISISYLIDNLWNIKPPLATVSVGPGELCLTLFSNAKKGKVGDLYIDHHGEVELKGSGGRPGSKAYALGTAKRLALILIKSKKDINKGYDIRKLLNDLLNSYKDNEKIFNNLEKTIQKLFQKQEIPYSVLEQYRLFRKKIYNLVQPNTNLISSFKTNNFIINIEKEINQLGLYNSKLKTEIVKLKKSLIGMGKKSGLLNLKYQYDIKRKENSKLSSTAIDKLKENFISYNKAIQNFFLIDWGLSKEMLIEGLLECRNHELSTHDLKKLKIDINNFFDIYANVTMLQDSKFMRDVIITLHIYCYQIDHGFTNLLIINDKQKKAYSLDFNYSNLFKGIFDQVHKVEIKTGLSVDPQFKSGVSMELQ